MARRVYPNLHAYFRDNPEESLTDVARELDISLPFLSMIKWGQRQPRLGLALALARRCNVPLESLIQSDRKSA